MSGLTFTLTMATRALQAQQGALDATTDNIANVNTPGYARKRATFEEAPIAGEGRWAMGSGVELTGFESVRDALVDLRLGEESQGQASAEAQVNTLGQIEVIFGNADASIGSAISTFFDSLEALSSDPSSTASREAVLAAAGDVARSFNGTVASLQQINTSLNSEIPQDVAQINTLATQLAEVNAKIAQSGRGDITASEFVDQQTNLIASLRQLTDITVVNGTDGITVSTANGSPLVVGSKAFSLSSSLQNGRTQVCDAYGVDITAKISGGQLNGAITVRDGLIPDLLNKLDTLATQFATAVNTANGSGFDANGNPGGDLFDASAGSAAGLRLATTDPSAVALSSDGSIGSNGNLSKFTQVRDQPLPAGQTPVGAYGALVFQVGTASASAKTQEQAAATMVRQLTAQQGAISGVSLDEETTNLMKYQHAYQAAAHVISVIDSLLQTILQIGG